MRTLRRIGMIAPGALLYCIAAQAVQILPDWVFTANTGTVDEADTALVAYNAASLSFRSGKAGTINVRYLVPQLLATGAKINATYLDAGSNDRIIARLKKLNLLTGAMTTELTFNSDSEEFTPAAAVQANEVATCETVFEPDYTYVLDVEIKRTSATGSNPAAHAFSVDNNGDCEI